MAEQNQTGTPVEAAPEEKTRMFSLFSIVRVALAVGAGLVGYYYIGNVAWIALLAMLVIFWGMPVTKNFGFWRGVITLAIGLGGSIVIWITAPFSDHVLNNMVQGVGSSPFTDTYLPPVVLFFAIMLVLCVNPLLRWLKPKLVLSKKQLAIAVGMMLVACSLPGQGLLKFLPYYVAGVPYYMNMGSFRQDAEIYGKHTKPKPGASKEEIAKIKEANSKLVDLPESLFINKIEFGKPGKESEQFVRELEPVDKNKPDGPKNPVPWQAWVKPLYSWGLLLLPMWLMMIGLALIVFPQWRDNERLAFPLLTLQEAVLEEPDEGKYLAPIFRSVPFWFFVVGVLVVHLLAGYKNYSVDGVPAIPLKWNIADIFSEGALKAAPYYIKMNQIYFIFIGLAYFMPSRISFSIWFFQLAYAIYTIVKETYFPPFYPNSIADQRFGATVMVAIAIVFLSRKHWCNVIKAIFSSNQSEEDKRNSRAGIMFFTGCAGVWAWMVYMTHVNPVWATMFVLYAFIVLLVTTRIVAETGLAFVRLHLHFGILPVLLSPVKWLSAQTLYMARMTSHMFAEASRVCVTTTAVHAIGLDKEASPKSQWNMAKILLGTLIIGLLICGGTHIWMNYHFKSSIDTKQVSPLNADYGLMMIFRTAHSDVRQFRDTNSIEREDYSQWGNIAFGATVAGLLQLACATWPAWPLHPIGILLVYTYYFGAIWVSVMIGWFAKIVIVRYGGVRAFRAARAAFMGMIVGEVFAAMFWLMEPAVRVWVDSIFKIYDVAP